MVARHDMALSDIYRKPIFKKNRISLPDEKANQKTQNGFIPAKKRIPVVLLLYIKRLKAQIYKQFRLCLNFQNYLAQSPNIYN